MTGAPQIFDRRLARGRLRKSLPARPGFLREAVEAELAERASLIVRRFERTLLCGTVVVDLPAQFGMVVMQDSEVAFDEEALPFPAESFDCIVSLLSFQGLNDLPGALAQMRRLLKPDGLLLACLFAGETLSELRQTWIEAELALAGGITPRVAPMIGVAELGGLLQRAGFALPVVDIDRTIVRYPSALALMREIRALGYGNSLADRSRHPVTRAMLGMAAQIYERDFTDPDGRVRATIDIAWLTGWTPHESQPQPLRPGSAKARLAEALGVPEIPVKR